MRYLKLFESFDKENLSIKLAKKGDEFKIFDLLLNGDKIGEIALEGDSTMTIIDSTIDEEYRGRGYYKQFLFQIVRRYNIKINSVFRSPEADRAWSSFVGKLPIDIKYKVYKDMDGNKNYEISLK